MESIKQSRLSRLLSRRTSSVRHNTSLVTDVDVDYVEVKQVDGTTSVVNTNVSVSDAKYDEVEDVDPDEIDTDDINTRLYGSDLNQELVSNSDTEPHYNCVEDEDDIGDGDGDGDGSDSTIEYNLRDLVECLFGSSDPDNDKHMHYLMVMHDTLLVCVVLLVAPIIVSELYFAMVVNDAVAHAYMEFCYSVLTVFVVVVFVVGVLNGVKNA